MTPPLPPSEADPTPEGASPAGQFAGDLPVLRENTQLMRRLMYLASDLVHVQDMRTQRLLYVNQRLTDTLGYTEADLPAFDYSLLNLVVSPRPAELGQFLSQRYATISDGETVEYEFTVRHKNGSLRLLRTRGSVLHRDAQGHPTEVVGVSEDITDEHTALNDLRRREALLRETEHLFSFGSWEWTEGADWVRWSEGLFRLLGYEPGEWPDGWVPESLYREHIPEAEARSYQQRVDAARVDQSPYEFDHWLITRQGLRRRVRVRGAVQVGTDNRQRLVGTVTDVSTEHEISERLRESEIVRSDIERFFGYGSWVWDLTGDARSLTWSEGNIRLFGYEPEELPGGRVTVDFFYRHVHPDDLERLQRVTHDALRRREPSLTLEFRGVTKRGQIRHFMRRARLVLDERGQPLRYIGHNVDVTDERQLADQLSRSEELNRRINEVSPDFIAIFDVKTGRNRYVGRQLRDLLGYSEKEVERHGGNLFFALEPEDWDKVREFQARIPSLADGEFLTYQMCMRAKDGRRLCLRSRATVFSRDEAGLPAELMSVTQDVTELEEKAEALRQSEAFNRRILELSPDFVNVHDLRTGQTRYLGRSLRERLGYSDEEVAQRGGTVFFAAETEADREKARRNMAGVWTLAEGEFVSHQVNLLNRAGQRVSLFMRATVLRRDETNTPTQALVVIHDVTEPERNAEALRQSEAFNRRLLELSPDVIGLYDLQTRRSRYVSAVTLPQWFGYTPEEVEALGGNLLGQFWDESEKARFEAGFAHALRTMADGEVVTFTMKMRRKAGTPLVLFVRVTSFRRDADGNPLEVMSIYQDVTEQETAAEALRKAQTLLSESEKALSMGTWEWDMASGELLWSAGQWRLFGYAATDTRPATLERFYRHVHPDDVPAMQAMLAEAVENHQPFQFEYRALTTEGQLRHVQGRGVPVLDTQGRLLRMVGNNVNVTDEKRSAALLEKQEYLLREAESLLNFGSWEWDITTGEILWSEGLYAVFGYDPDTRPERITFEVYRQHLHPDELERAMQRNAEVMREKGSFEGQYRIITHTGQERWVHEKGIVVTNDRGEVVRLMGSTADVTQLRTYQTELEQRIADLHRSNANLEQFAYVASHDLQEPLRKITSFGERLIKRHAEGLGGEGRLFLERMIEATARMKALIDNLLDFSRVTRRLNTFVPTDLNAVLRSVLGDLEMKIAEKGATIEQDSLPTLDSIPGQMQQLFQNLLSNALKFSQAGRPPVIQVRVRSVGTAERTQYPISPRGNYVRIDIQDNGIGFEPEYSERIFVLFQRLHGRSEYDGTGIGLAIVKKIVENHQGIISAESAPGQGARFTLLLPLKQEHIS
jgi:PAS domain S-box-containing protein